MGRNKSNRNQKIHKINKSKNWFFEKSNKIYFPLVQLVKNKTTTTKK